MKKFFKNLAVASLAIAGILVSSCTIEDIKTAFEPTNAVATISVTAIDVLHGNADVSTDSELKLEASSTANCVIKTEGNKIIIEGAPALQEQTVTINAEYKGNTGKTTVSVPSLRAGGTATIPATVIVGTVQEKEAVANATVQVSVWDNVSGKDVTSEATYSYSGAPSDCTAKEGDAKGSYIISREGGISAFKLEVTATYGGNSNKTTVEIGDISEGDTKTYVASIEVGTAPEPVKTPAVAKINVKVVDGTLQKDVTEESTIDAKFVGEEPKESLTKEGNLITVTAGESLELKNVGILITAKYEEFEGETVVTIAKVPEGGVIDYTATVIIKNPAEYVPVKVSEKVTDVKVGTLKSTHGLHTYTHDYSHATTGHGHGTGEWLYNETEFILETTIDYENEYGTMNSYEIEFTPDTTPSDMAMVNYLYEALKGKEIVKEPAQLQIRVSAFAMYSAFCTKTTKAHKYNIIRRESGKDDVLVGIVTVYTVSTQAEYCEAAIPGHEGHYVHGHGHDDIHGYSSNAGGGIFFVE